MWNGNRTGCGMGIRLAMEWESDCLLLCSRVDQVTAEVNELKRAFQAFKHRRESAVSIYNFPITVGVLSPLLPSPFFSSPPPSFPFPPSLPPPPPFFSPSSISLHYSSTLPSLSSFLPPSLPLFLSPSLPSSLPPSLTPGAGGQAERRATVQEVCPKRELHLLHRAPLH